MSDETPIGEVELDELVRGLDQRPPKWPEIRLQAELTRRLIVALDRSSKRLQCLTVVLVVFTAALFAVAVATFVVQITD